MAEMILVTSTVVLCTIIIFVLYKVVSIRATVRSNKDETNPSRITHRVSAEVFVETFRGKEKEEGEDNE